MNKTTLAILESVDLSIIVNALHYAAGQVAQSNGDVAAFGDEDPDTQVCISEQALKLANLLETTFITADTDVVVVDRETGLTMLNSEDTEVVYVK